MKNTGDVKTELENKLKAQKRTIKPHKRCALTENYKYGAQFQRENTQIMEYSIPLTTFIKNAQGWGQLDHNRFPNYAEYVDLFKLLIAQLAYRVKKQQYSACITCELIPRKPNEAPVNVTGNMNTKDFELYEFLIHERTQKDYIRMRLRLTANFQRTDDRGMRLFMDDENLQQQPQNEEGKRVIVKNLNTLGLILYDFLEENDKLYNTAKKYGKLGALNKVQCMSMGTWRMMVAVLTAQNLNVDDSNSSCINEDSVWNPCVAFPPLKDVTQVAVEGGAIECCNGDNYVMVDHNGFTLLTFPFDSRYVYRISQKSWEIDDQDVRYLPHISPPDHCINVEQAVYLHQLGFNEAKLRLLDDETRANIKVGLPNHALRNRSRPEYVAQIMEKMDEMNIEELEEHMRVVALSTRVEDVDSDSEDFKRSHSRAVIEGIDLLPSMKQTMDTYNTITLQKRSGHTPDMDIDEFEKQSRELYKKQVECYPQIIDNPAYSRALKLALRKCKLRSDHLIMQNLKQIPRDHPFWKQEYKFLPPKKILNPQWKEARHAFLISRFIDFEQQIWHEDACIPDAVKAICIWERLHRKNPDGTDNKKNYSMYQPHRRKNLSSFADTMVNRMDQLEAVEDTFTTHSNTLLVLLAALQVYFPTIFHVHVMLAGPPMGGKSRTEQKAGDNLIYGTFEFITYESAKSKTGADPQSQNQMIQFFEEIMPSVIGVGAKDESSASNELAIFKNLLTRGEMTYSVLQMAEHGKRFQEKQTIKVNNVIIAATNAYFSQMPPSIRSRFVTITVQQDERPDRGGATAKLSGHNPIKQMAANVTQNHWKRDQCFTAKLAYFIKGLSCMLNLNTDCAKAVFALVAESAVKEPYCLRGFDDVRKMEQLNMITQSLVCVDAIHTVFDSSVSEIKDLTWHPTHFLKLLPHLFSKVEHAVFALGLIEHQFEDIIAQNVSDSLVKYIFDGDKINTNNNIPQLIQAENPEEFKHTEEKKKAKDNDGDDEMKLRPNPAHRSLIQTIIPTAAEAATEAAKPPQPPTTTKRKPGRPPYVQTDEKKQLQTYQNNGAPTIEDHYTCIDMNRIGLSTYKKNTEASKAESNTTIIKRLAELLASKMVPTPQVGDIIHNLTELTQKLVSRTSMVHKVTGINSVNGYSSLGGPQLITIKTPVLEIDTINNKLKILTSYIQEHKGGRKRLLKTCIERKLSHKYARKNTFLYGSPMNQHPNVWDIVEVNPGTENLKLINQDYFHREICKSVIESVKYVDQDLDPLKIKWESMFAAHRFTKINTDLDDYFTYSYNDKNVYTEQEVKTNDVLNLPNNHPFVTSQRLQVIHEPTIEYPECQFAEEEEKEEPHNNKRKADTMTYGIQKFKRRAQGIYNDDDDDDYGYSDDAAAMSQEQEQEEDEEPVADADMRVEDHDLESQMLAVDC